MYSAKYLSYMTESVSAAFTSLNCMQHFCAKYFNSLLSVHKSTVFYIIPSSRHTLLPVSYSLPSDSHTRRHNAHY